MHRSIYLCVVLVASVQSFSGCRPAQAPYSSTNSAQQHINFQVSSLATFNEPWAMTQLADGRLLITEKAGTLKLFDPKTQHSVAVLGVPKVAYGGQGGLGDVALHPNFKNNRWIYLSYAQQGQGGYGAEIIRAKLELSNAQAPQLREVKLIWQQVPKLSGQGHYGHRLLFDAAGKLWVSSGERQHFDPAQNLQSNLGKILRLNDDGTAAKGNPFANQGAVAAQVWSLGHRNSLGMAFAPDGQLWVAEMGPRGGDELNKIIRGKNYGYPIVSNGDHYSGLPIPDHATRPEFAAPELSWTPVISPSSLLIYSGRQFPHWQQHAIMSGLSSKAIIIVDIRQQPVREVQRIEMGERMRGVLQATDGAIWLLEDGKNAKLLKLSRAE